MIGHWHWLVIDCPNPSELAYFYQQLLGMVRVEESLGWVTIGETDRRPSMAFQKVDGFRAPRWPDPEATPASSRHKARRRPDDSPRAAGSLRLSATELPVLGPFLGRFSTGVSLHHPSPIQGKKGRPDLGSPGTGTPCA